MRLAPPGAMEEVLHQGLKLVLMLNGALDCEMPGHGKVAVRGPCLCVVADDGGHCAVQAFHADQPLHYVMLTIDAGACEDLLGQALGDWRRSLPVAAGRMGPLYMDRIAAPALVSLAHQILTCPIRGAGQRLYRMGKAMELAGLAVDLLAQASAPLPSLGVSDIERLHAVRDLLLSRLDDPPDLAELSRYAGMNLRKLSHGYRVIFGETPAGFVQSARLDRAHGLISSGAWSVSQAAWEVGYTPAAFATAFRRRFGLSPSALRS